MIYRTNRMYRGIIIGILLFLVVLNAMIVLLTPSDVRFIIWFVIGSSVMLCMYIYVKLAKTAFSMLKIDDKGVSYSLPFSSVSWPWDDIGAIVKKEYVVHAYYDSREWSTVITNARTGLEISLGSEFAENVHDTLIAQKYSRSSAQH
jgi:hypothetical protein